MKRLFCVCKIQITHPKAPLSQSSEAVRNRVFGCFGRRRERASWTDFEPWACGKRAGRRPGGSGGGGRGCGGAGRPRPRAAARPPLRRRPCDRARPRGPGTGSPAAGGGVVHGRFTPREDATIRAAVAAFAGATHVAPLVVALPRLAGGCGGGGLVQIRLFPPSTRRLSQPLFCSIFSLKIGGSSIMRAYKIQGRGGRGCRARGGGEKHVEPSARKK